MAATTHITLDMCLEELQRIQDNAKKYYPGRVAKGELSPYTRDHRYAVHKKLVELFSQAKKNRAANGPTLIEILKNIPNE